MIGRADRLEMRPAVEHWKADGVDLLADPPPARRPGQRGAARGADARITGSSEALDNTLIALASAALERREPVEIRLPIRNEQPHRRHHARVRKSRGATAATGLPDDTINVQFTGSAGQSFGAFVPRGITLAPRRRLERLLGQGAVGRQAGRLSAAAVDLRVRTRTSSSATSACTARPAARPTSAASPASGSRSATAAPWRWSKALATTAAST